MLQQHNVLPAQRISKGIGWVRGNIHKTNRKEFASNELHRDVSARGSWYGVNTKYYNWYSMNYLPRRYLAGPKRIPSGIITRKDLDFQY